MQGAETQGVSCCCCVSGEVTGTFRIDRMAYVPGENIIINAEIQNKSNTDVSGSRVAIKQVRLKIRNILGVIEMLVEWLILENSECSNDFCLPFWFVQCQKAGLEI